MVVYYRGNVKNEVESRWPKREASRDCANLIEEKRIWFVYRSTGNARATRPNLSTITYDFMAHNVSFGSSVSFHVGHPSYSMHVLGWLDTSKTADYPSPSFSEFCTNAISRSPV